MHAYFIITTWVFLMICVEEVQTGCPVGYDRLDNCIGGECPNTVEAGGRAYQCIGDDCCALNNNNAAGVCIDNAVNCASFIFNCQTPVYVQCMIRNCGRTCGFCTGR